MKFYTYVCDKEEVVVNFNFKSEGGECECCAPQFCIAKMKVCKMRKGAYCFKMRNKKCCKKFL